VPSLKTDLSRAYGEPIETHTSWVFLDGERVWKIKKPVNFGFLDHTTAEKRRVSCEAEVRLNARLAPRVYRGVVPVTRDATGRHAVGGDGEIVDWAVEMVRLDESTRGDVLLERGLLTRADVSRIAEHIAAFHARMASGPEIAAYGMPDSVLANVRENFTQTRDAVRSHVGEAAAVEIEAKQVGFVEAHRDVFLSRIQSGRIRDGHGDLRLEHVYLSPDEPPTIIDCIEFNDRFRYADVCADVAFLSMDLERLGRADFAEQFLAAYARASNDYGLYALADFYEGYRAHVRAKVASILARDEGASFETRESAESAARLAFLLTLATGRKSLMEPTVVAVGGIIASGKSTVSERLSELLSAPIVDADRTRKDMLRTTPTARLDDAAWAGAYSEAFTERVYAEVVRRASDVLSSGRPVILDASFRSRKFRALAKELAASHGVPFCFVECRVALEECKRRLIRRREAPSISDGRLEILDAFMARWEPVDELDAAEHIVMDTGESLEKGLAELAPRLPVWPRGLNR